MCVLFDRMIDDPMLCEVLFCGHRSQKLVKARQILFSPSLLSLFRPNAGIGLVSFQAVPVVFWRIFLGMEEVCYGYFLLMQSRAAYSESGI